MNLVHTKITMYYVILTPLIWFSEGEEVSHSNFSKYFNQLAIKDLLERKYIIIKSVTNK